MNPDIIDLPDFLERVQDDKELLLELLDIYEADFKMKRSLLENAIKGNNSEEVKNIAHSLKGASGNISVTALRTTFHTLEEMGKNKDLSSALALLPKIDADFALFQKRMGELKVELK